MTEPKEQNSTTGLEIAIIGMSGRFPGAKNIEQFWENLKNGVESISFFTDEELEEAGVDPCLLNHPNYVKAKGMLADIEYFDYRFFDYSPKEAELMDPQMRIFHECVWEALEHAGYNPDRYSGSIGLYAGASSNVYWQVLPYIQKNSHPEANTSEQFAALQMVNKDYLATRIAYKLNLKGPAVAVQTACSTSLVAIHMACRALLTGECKIALAGGITVTLPHKTGYLYQDGMILSPDGHCRAFDAQAQGTVGGEGVGVVVLKQLKHALADGDTIHAVIKGSAVNNDGDQKVGYTAPSIEGQVEVIRTAQRFARVQSESIGYVETHGTGTVIGDPVEIEALRLAFQTDQVGFCSIGSVKSNIGHLDSAAGVAGLIKTVLALKYRMIPPSLHFHTPNPQIDFSRSPFYVNTELKEWKTTRYPLRAGISSFGIGGTNAHIVLEEAPNNTPSSVSRNMQMLVLSAKTESALEQITINLKEYLGKNPEINLADAAYTLQVGRKEFKYRRALVCQDTKEAIAELTVWYEMYRGETVGEQRAKVHSFYTHVEDRPVVFMFSGQGSQYSNMGRELYETERVFREEMDGCFSILASLTGIDFKEVLFPNGLTAAEELVHQTAMTQPIIFSFEYSLARLLMSWGIKPTSMIGYSFGEYVAACLAGVFTVEDALKLIVVRGRLMQDLPVGAMLSVPLTEKELLPLLHQGVSLAIINGPSCVVGGSKAAIEAFEGEMRNRGYLCMRIGVSHAAHSAEMDAITSRFTEEAQKIQYNEPRIPYISNMTGRWITKKEATDPKYWARHMRETVRFADGIQLLAGRSHQVFVEIGPGRDLSTLIARFIDEKRGQYVVDLIKHPKRNVSDLNYLFNKVSWLWVLGVKVNWQDFYSFEKRKRIPLPTYPYEKHNLGSKIFKQVNVSKIIGQAADGKFTDNSTLDRWFYIPSWKRSLLTQSELQSDSTTWLILTDECGIGEKLAKELTVHEERVIVVQAGREFTRLDDRQYIVNPESDTDFDLLIKKVQSDGLPTQIIHLWNVSEIAQIAHSIEQAQTQGFFSLLYLVQALGKHCPDHEVLISVISNNMQDVAGQELYCPEKAVLLGPVKVIPQEYPNIRCKSIDIILPSPESWQMTRLIEQLLREIRVDAPESVIAYRGNHRYVQTFESVQMNDGSEGSDLIRENGVYLITGGTGGIGLILASELARKKKVRLALLGRSGLPKRERWPEWLAEHTEDDIAQKIQSIQKIEQTGSEVMILGGDVAVPGEMRNVLDLIHKTYGQLNGVIHAAGVADGAVIQRRTRETSQKVLEPKVQGTVTLVELLQETELDFLIFCSSLASITGPFGQVAYAAANAFLDAFASYRTSSTGQLTLSINWDRWKNVGIARSVEELHQKLTGDILAGGLSAEEGAEAFGRILQCTTSQIAVSTTDLSSSPKHVEVIGDKQDDTMEVIHDSFEEHFRPELGVEYVAPRNQMEAQLVRIWEDFFGIKAIGVHDDFLDLGGDSLKAIILITKIDKEVGVRIPIARFFETPTIAGVADYIQNKTADTSDIADQASEEIGEVQRFRLARIDEKTLSWLIGDDSNISDIYPLSPMQKNILAHNLIAANTGLSTSVFSCKMEGKLDLRAFKQAWQKVIERHSILRTTFRWRRLEEPLQMVYHSVNLPWDEMDASQGSTEEQNSLIQNYICLEEKQGYKVTQFPLMRFAIIRLNAHSYQFVWSYQNSLFDGWSTSLIFREVMTIYQAIINGKEPDLAESKPFVNYIKWLEAQDQKEAQEFWTQQFANYSPSHALLDRVEEMGNQAIIPAEQKICLPETVTQELGEFARIQGLTINTLILGCWALLISQEEDTHDLLLGLVTSGRSANLEGIESMVGLFTNTLPLRIKLMSKETVLVWLKTLQQQLLKVTQYEYVTAQQIAKWCGIPEKILQHAIQEKTLVYINYPIALANEEKDGELKIYQQKASGQLNVPLRVYVETGSALNITLHYDRQRYSDQKAQQIIENIRVLLEKVQDSQVQGGAEYE